MPKTAKGPVKLDSGKLQVTTPSDRELAMIRTFDAPRGLVFDAWTKPELLEKGGKSTVTTTVLYATREARDGVLRSPMEGGVAKSYDKLAEVLASTISRKRE